MSEEVLNWRARNRTLLARQLLLDRADLFNTKTPHSVPTFLVDGQVAGTWRFDDDMIRIDPFEPLPRSVRRAVEDEADRLRTFHTEGR